MVEVDMTIQNIVLEELHADDEFNCRGKILPIDVVDLAKDIERQGLIQPVVATPYDEEKQEETGKKYRLIAGYRRYTAHIVLKRATIPTIVRTDMVDDAQARIFNLAENMQRKSLNVLQEARAINKLKQLGLPEHACAERLGKSRGWVQIRYMLLDLPMEIQLEVGLGTITQTQVRELFTIQKNAGKEACYSAAKDLKEAKARGRTISVNPNKVKPKQKRIRKRVEIFEMMEHIVDSGIGNGIWTRLLAWAAGEINDLDVEESLVIFANENGVTYNRREVKVYGNTLQE